MTISCKCTDPETIMKNRTELGFFFQKCPWHCSASLASIFAFNSQRLYNNLIVSKYRSDPVVCHKTLKIRICLPTKNVFLSHPVKGSNIGGSDLSHFLIKIHSSALSEEPVNVPLCSLPYIPVPSCTTFVVWII